MFNNQITSIPDQFNTMVATLEAFDARHDKKDAVNWTDNLTSAHKSIINKTFNAVVDFLNTNSLYSNGVAFNSVLNKNENTQVINPSVSIPESIGAEKLFNLAAACGIHNTDLRPACESMSHLLLEYSNAGTGQEVYSTHFGSTRDGIKGQSTMLADLHDLLPASLHSEFLTGFTPSMEAFGAETDRVLPDIRVAMTVSLLRFHRGMVDRVFHRRTSPSTVIKYVIPYAEVYDLMKSMDNSGDVRNGREHRVPMRDLYGDPKVVTNKLRPIKVLAANNANVVLRDGVLKPNCKGNVMDLSRVAGQIGNNHTDYTDLIADGVILDRVFVKLTKGSTSEEFEIVTRSFTKARLHMEANTTDSANRSTIFKQFFKFSKSRKTIAGSDSTLLSTLTDNDCIEIELNVVPQINLKFHDVSNTSAVYMRPYSSTGATQPAEAVTTAMTGLTAEIVGYSLDMSFSEENLRKSNVAIRSHYRTIDWEIPVGRNYIVDYAMNEALPEYVMANVTEAISLGQDHRAINMIVENLMDVYDRGREENKDVNFREDIYKLGFDYVAGQQVRPTVYLGSIDLSEVDTIRSSDILGDIRQYVELQLINAISLLHQNSYYRTQLNPGEKPVYRVITSSIILENLLNVPHIHNHLQAAAEESVDDTIEYRRVLPCGVILECVTTTFDYLRDRIIIIPFRPNDPESVLNYGHNWAYGTFTAHYNPQIANGVNKRIFANAREMPLVTNPCGLYFEVTNISKIIDMFQLVNPRGTSGLDLPAIEGRLPDTSALKGPGNATW